MTAPLVMERQSTGTFRLVKRHIHTRFGDKTSMRWSDGDAAMCVVNGALKKGK